MTSFSDSVKDWIFPPTCALCGALGAPSPCETCAGTFEREDASLDLRPELDAAFALYGFAGIAGEAVRALKFARRTDLASWTAAEMALGLRRSGLQADVVVPVPIHWRRRAGRGFNQSDLLIADLPLPRAELALRRTRMTKAQAKLNPAARAKNLTGAFVASGVTGRRVLLVDDVVTSGHTARECARALRTAGADEVLLLTFASAN